MTERTFFEELFDKAQIPYCLARAMFYRGFDDGELPLHESPKHQAVTVLQSSRKPDKRLIVRQWNIYQANRLSAAREGLASLLQGDATVLLQEAPSPDHPLYEGLLVGKNVLYAPDFFFDIQNRPSHHTGNMIISPYDFDEYHVINLPRVAWAYHGKNRPIRRNALQATINDIGIATTHLDIYCHPDDRQRQLLPLLQQARPRQIIGADLNTLGELFARVPDEDWYLRMRRRTEPVFLSLEASRFSDELMLSDLPARAFSDYIFARGVSKKLVERRSERGSDHAPLGVHFTY